LTNGRNSLAASIRSLKRFPRRTNSHQRRLRLLENPFFVCPLSRDIMVTKAQRDDIPQVIFSIGLMTKTFRPSADATATGKYFNGVWERPIRESNEEGFKAGRIGHGPALPGR
jgi:hypothetical protein